MTLFGEYAKTCLKCSSNIVQDLRLGQVDAEKKERLENLAADTCSSFVELLVRRANQESAAKMTLQMYREACLSSLSGLLGCKTLLLDLTGTYQALIGEIQSQAFVHVESEIDRAEDYLTNIYVNACSKRLMEIVGQGAGVEAFDWKTKSQPRAIRQWVFDLLLELVHVQTEIHAINAGLTDYIMISIVDRIFAQVVGCVNSISEFGTGGALQISLDVQFLKHILGDYFNEESQENYGAFLERMASERKKTGLKGDPMEHVKHILIDAERFRETQFSCFSVK